MSFRTAAIFLLFTFGFAAGADPVWTSRSGFMFTPGAGVILTDRARELGNWREH